MKLFFIVFAFVSPNLFAGDLTQSVTERANYLRTHEDLSHFMISVQSEGQPITDRHTKVHFIVVDSQGHKTGFKSFFTTERGTLLVNAYDGIPNSSYGVNQADSLDPNVVPDEPESATLDLFMPVIKDTYTIRLMGFDNCRYSANMYVRDLQGAAKSTAYEAYITSGAVQEYSVYVDPTPGAPEPVVAKTVTFDVVRQDLAVAQKLGQLGEDKFTNSLLKQLSQAEKLSAMCEKRKEHEKAKGCGPAVSVLKLFVKRLELANKKCDKPEACDEERPWTAFRKEHGRDHDYDDFFRDWDRDDWHKWKKKAKRFVTDEALGIIKGDAEILLQDLAGAVKHDSEKGKDKKR